MNGVSKSAARYNDLNDMTEHSESHIVCIEDSNDSHDCKRLHEGKRKHKSI